jgi:hypothetical protein
MQPYRIGYALCEQSAPRRSGPVRQQMSTTTKRVSRQPCANLLWLTSLSRQLQQAIVFALPTQRARVYSTRSLRQDYSTIASAAITLFVRLPSGKAVRPMHTVTANALRIPLVTVHSGRLPPQRSQTACALRTGSATRRSGKSCAARASGTRFAAHIRCARAHSGKPWGRRSTRIECARITHSAPPASGRAHLLPPRATAFARR